MDLDEGPHADDPELRRLTLDLRQAVSLDPRSDHSAALLEEYTSVVKRRESELVDQPRQLAQLRLDHAITIIDVAEASGLDTWRQLEPLADLATQLMRRTAREQPHTAEGEEARRLLERHGISLDEPGEDPDVG